MTRIEIETERANSMASLREKRNLPRKQYEIERRAIDYRYSDQLDRLARTDDGPSPSVG
jgi:hypothetical protein